jgi:hypothetical protein
LLERIPAAIAQLVGVSPEHIAFMPPTSYGLAVAALTSVRPDFLGGARRLDVGQRTSPTGVLNRQRDPPTSSGAQAAFFKGVGGFVQTPPLSPSYV